MNHITVLYLAFNAQMPLGFYEAWEAADSEGLLPFYDAWDVAEPSSSSTQPPSAWVPCEENEAARAEKAGKRKRRLPQPLKPKTEEIAEEGQRDSGPVAVPIVANRESDTEPSSEHDYNDKKEVAWYRYHMAWPKVKAEDDEAEPLPSPQENYGVSQVDAAVHLTLEEQTAAKALAAIAEAVAGTLLGNDVPGAQTKDSSRPPMPLKVQAPAIFAQPVTPPKRKADLQRPVTPPKAKADPQRPVTPPKATAPHPPWAEPRLLPPPPKQQQGSSSTSAADAAAQPLAGTTALPPKRHAWPKVPGPAPKLQGPPPPPPGQDNVPEYRQVKHKAGKEHEGYFYVS